MAEKEKIEKEEEYELVQIPIEYKLAIQAPSGEKMSLEEAIVQILNKLNKLEKNIG